MNPSRRTVLAVLLAALLALTAVVLADVLSTVTFAVTVGYVLYPLRRRVRERGASRRAAAASVTVAAFLGTLALVAPVMYLLYQRVDAFLDLVLALPDRIPVELAGFTYVVEVEAAFTALASALQGVAVAVATAAPVLALKALLFVLLIYGLLYRPHAPQLAALRLCPREYHDVLFALHRRTASTLRAIYVLQAATAAATFAVALVTFWALGYRSPFGLAVVSGVLQFIPVLGPSIVIVGLAGYDLILGNAVRAALVVAVGLPAVGFAPDAVIRPRLAGETTDLPVSVYFVGFVGGVLTLGPVGFVVGPLVVALLAEVVSLLSAGPTTRQTRLTDSDE